jgi:hypothetical protein
MTEYLKIQHRPVDEWEFPGHEPAWVDFGVTNADDAPAMLQRGIDTIQMERQKWRVFGPVGPTALDQLDPSPYGPLSFWRWDADA